MKSIIIAVIAGTFGLIIGAWIPQSELRVKDLKIDQLEEKLADCDTRITPMIGELTKMLGVNQDKTQKIKPRPPAPASTSEDPLDSDIGEIPEDQQFGNGEFDFDDPAFDGAESMEDALEIASGLWDVRRKQAMAVMVEDLDLTEGEIEDFEQNMDTMNRKLEEEIENFANQLADQDTPSPEDGLRIAHGVAGILLESYDEMDEIFPEDWRQNTGPETGPMNFIDPMVARPFLELEGEMEWGSEYDEN